MSNYPEYPWVPWRKGFNPITGSGHFRFDAILPGRIFLLEGVDVSFTKGLTSSNINAGLQILPGGSFTAPQFWGFSADWTSELDSELYFYWRGAIPVSYLDGVYLAFDGPDDGTYSAMYWGRVLPQAEAPV